MNQAQTGTEFTVISYLTGCLLDSVLLEITAGVKTQLLLIPNLRPFVEVPQIAQEEAVRSIIGESALKIGLFIARLVGGIENSAQKCFNDSVSVLAVDFFPEVGSSSSFPLVTLLIDD